MSLIVTSHRNDRPLARALGGHAETQHLEYGDVNFFGVWSGGTPIAVSVERKRVPDLVQCLHNGRLMAQLQNSLSAGFDLQAVVVEGEVSYDVDEYLVYRRRRCLPETKFLRYREFLLELTLYCGVQVIETRNVQETADRILILSHLLQRPPERHSGLKTIYSEPPPMVSLLGRPSLMRRIAHQLPGVGWSRAEAIEQVFPTVTALINATEKELAAVDGIGKGTARDIREAVE